MFKQSATRLQSLPKEKIKAFINSFDTVLTDCDGVTWVLKNALPGASGVINRFMDIGKKVFFVTNSNAMTREEFRMKANTLGFLITHERIISTAYLVAQYLKHQNFSKTVYLVGGQGIVKELNDVGIKNIGFGPDVIPKDLPTFLMDDFKQNPEVGAVVVGMDIHFSIPKLIRACNYVKDPKCLFLATNTDERFPLPDLVIPGTGALVRAVETAAQRKPFIVGKPNPYICEALIKEHNVNPERTLMIGDRCNTDILLGSNCGFQTLLVESGVHKESDVKPWLSSNNPEELKLVPDFITSKLGDLLEYLD